MRRRNLSGISDYVMSQVIGVSISNLQRDIIFKDIESINGFNCKDSLIDCLEFINKPGSYNKNIKDFLENIIICNDLDLDIEETEEWDDEDLSLFTEFKHKDLWDYRINLFKEGALIIKEKPKKPLKSIDWGYSDPSINKYLNSMPIVLSNKAYDIFRNTDPHEIYSLIYSEQGNDLTTIYNYKELIFTEGTLLNKLFNIKEEGSGKGEALISFLYPSKVMGMGDNFDILAETGEKIEIKSPNCCSFRFGTKASIGNYEFFSNILESRSVLKNLVNQLGNEFKELVTPELYELSMQFIQKGNFKTERAISSAIDSAEVNSERLHLITLWFYLAHIETFGYDPVFNPIDQDVFNKEYHQRYGLIGNKNDLINVLHSLEYVKKPWKFKQDIQKEIKECFKGINTLLIFNEKNKEINIYKSHEDIIMDSISQNGIKVIEKKYRKKVNTTIEDTYEKWKQQKNINFYHLYNNLEEVVVNQIESQLT